MKKKNKNINKKVNININNILDKLSRKKKMIIIFIMIIISILGGTFAWFSYQSKKSALVLTIGDLNDSQVIITPYEIRDTMLPVNSYINGVYSQITVINNNDSKMNMELYYKANTLPQELAQSGLKYTIVQSDSKDGTYTEVLTNDFSNYNNESEIDIFKIKINSNTTTYYRLYLWLDSSVGNQTVLENYNLDLELNANISRDANPPILDTGMIPVTISNDGTVTTISSDNDSWYDYSNQEWANAILVTESSRSSYLNTTDVVVQESDILAYYVWIPRYKYKIWTTSVSSTGNEQEIGIIFESVTSSKSNGTKVGEYLTHPAFTFGDEELSGFWVGKFETTGTADTPTVLPNTTSLRSQTVSTQFTTSLKFSGGTLSDGNVTFAGSSTYGLSKNTDSHMMKNSEWGAVAYLSHSKYGINEEIYINNSSSYYTGRSGGAVCGSTNTVKVQYSGSSTSTNKYYNYGYYTWLGQIVNYDGTIGEIADATLGTKASTTGNITGIYDMSGGTYEFVMGNYNSKTGSSGFTTFPNAKYYDVYLITSNSNCTLTTCGGHALYETNNWYGDNPNLATSSKPWFLRGGISTNSSLNAGIFYSDIETGASSKTLSFRSVLIPRHVADVEFNPNGGTTVISYTEPGEYTYTVSSTGEYRLEVWGAQGGTGMVDGTSKNIGGYGGYSTGNISLNANANLYINVGGKGENAQDRQAGGAGGYNGGGTGGKDSNYTSSGSNEPGAGGGGATHIATTSGLLSTLSSNTDSILIVAGAGGGGAYNSVGGTGGGISGNIGGNSTTTGGNQSSGNSFGLGGAGSSYSGGSGAGGSGYYGGLGGTANGVSGAGGSGYIGNSSLTNKYMYCYNCETSDEESTKTFTTENVSEAPTTNYAKSGDGAARISTSSNIIQTITSNETNIPYATKDGYIFKGWNTKLDGSGDYITNNLEILSLNINTLYAIWEQIFTVTITYNANSGTLSKTYTDPGEYELSLLANNNYKLEVWGAQGGTGMVDGTSKNIGGYGGYSVGNISFSTNTNLYINVGGKGENAQDKQAGGSGGYNGGGTGGTDSNYTSSGSNEPGGGGGGATHIATISGLLSTLSDNTSSILIVAGAGGGGAYNSVGGSGGGISGNIGGNSTTTGGNQLSGNYFGLGGDGSTYNGGSGAGGSGYYGGLGGTANGISGAGGSGYIGNSLLNNKYMYCYNCTTSDEESTKTYTTENISETPTTNYAKSGDGAAVISTTGNFIKVQTSDMVYGDMPQGKKDGYRLVGWNTNSDGSGTYITDESQLISNSDHTLYAIWEEINTTIPIFTYTGTYEIVDDDDNIITDPLTYKDNWKIRFLTSGTLIFSELNGADDGIDVFLVGGGGGGGTGGNYAEGATAKGGGGGGGYTTTSKAVSVVINTDYVITVGSGGAVVSTGGSTSAFDFSASGGNNGGTTWWTGWSTCSGGDGGSGGGMTGKSGGTDGGDGGSADGGSRYGKGQGTTTREFGESSGTMYSSGGAGSGNADGKANTGNGGGGGYPSAGTGGSGIVIIRNAR